MTRTCALLFASLALAACAPRPIPADQVPVYGSAPLYHTVYLGSDDQYHHFVYNHGLSSGEILVRIGDATIYPAPFSVGANKQAFVKSTGPRRIDLIGFKSGG